MVVAKNDDTQLVHVGRLRTGKERFYFGVSVVVSLLGWVWIFYSAARALLPRTSVQSFSRYISCVYRDKYNGNRITEIDEKFNIRGERCLSESELTSKERTQLEQYRARWAQEPDTCLVRNSYTGYNNILRIHQYQLAEGERCLSPQTLVNEECYADINEGTTKPREIRKVDFTELEVGKACIPKSSLTSEEIRLAQIAKDNRIASYSTQERITITRPDVPPTLPRKSIIPQSISGISTPFFLIVLFFFSLFAHLLAMAYIRMNGIKVGPYQFPSIWHAATELSKRVGMRRQPDIFVITGHGVLNAFATRLVFRKIIVVYSDLAETLLEHQDQRQLEAVLSHELGHQVLGHTRLTEWFLWPARLIPYLGAALSRAREYSSDRVMKALIEDQAVCERALIKLAGGRVLGNVANIEVFVQQLKEERGFFSWMAEVLATHPHLPKRILAIRKFSFH